MPIPIVNGWPDTFDFETDAVCQKLFKPFIKEELASLRAYDDARPEEKTISSTNMPRAWPRMSKRPACI